MIRKLAVMAVGAMVASVGLVAVDPTPADATAQACYVSNYKNDTIRIRQYKSTSSAIVGYIYPGYTVSSACGYEYGGSYSCFGHSGTEWVAIPGVGGYVGWRCVTGP